MNEANRPLYLPSSTFWENFKSGPRPLTGEELLLNRRLGAEIAELERQGLNTEIKLFGKKVRSPVGLAAGPAPNANWLNFFAELGYDILTHKTVRDRYWEGHPLPNILCVDGDFKGGFSVATEYHGTITNSLGMPSAEPVVWRREVGKVLEAHPERFVVVSVTATATPKTGEREVIEQFAALAGTVKQAGAHAVELNFSCPNVVAEGSGEVYEDAELCGSILGAVRDHTGSAYPVLLKTGFLSDYSPLVDKTCVGPVGYVVINAMAAEVRGGGGELMFASRGGKAGIAGAALLEFTTRAVRGLEKLRRGRREFSVFAVGGVTRPEDAMKLLEAGADVIESATGAIYDPSLAFRIKKALLERGRGRGS